jgi:hypothetical protein
MVKKGDNIKIEIDNEQFIRIGPFDYKYREVEGFGSSEVIGECDFFNAEIKLSKNLNPLRKFNILLHEIIEAIVDMYELDVNHLTIQTMATALSQVFIDNNIYGFIQGIDKDLKIRWKMDV